MQFLGALLNYDPLVNIEIGPFDISPHGLGIAAGYLLGAMFLFIPAAERRGISQATTYSMLTRGAVGAIVGARLAYVLNHVSEFSDQPLDIFAVWEGGISLLGGIAGAVLFAATKMRSEGLSFWRVMDAVVPGLAFGIILGRIGDLVIADHLGKATDFFLGYECPNEPLIVGENIGSACVAGPGGVVHQPALYDLFSVLLLLPLLLRLRRRPRYEGFLTLVFAAWYGAGRFVEDWFRIDETHGLALTGSQWTAIAVMALALVWLIGPRRTPWGSGRGRHRSEPSSLRYGWDTPAYRAEFDAWVEALEAAGIDPQADEARALIDLWPPSDPTVAPTEPTEPTEVPESAHSTDPT